MSYLDQNQRKVILNIKGILDTKNKQISRENLIRLIPKNNVSYSLIISLLSTPTSLREILNYNPIIISALIDQPMKRKIANLTYKLLNEVNFQPTHIKHLKSKINDLDEDLYIKIGFFVIPHNFIKKLSKSTLDFLTIKEKYKFREFIYLSKKDTKFYKDLYVHKKFKKEKLKILQIVDDKEKLLLLKKFSLDQVDYIYSIRKNLGSKCILPIIEYKVKKGIIENYKYKKRYLMIVHKKLGIINQIIDIEYQMEFQGNEILKKYFLSINVNAKSENIENCNTKTININENTESQKITNINEIEDFLNKNINGYVKYILMFIRYTLKYEYLLKIQNKDILKNLLVKEDIVNNVIAKEAIKISNNNKLMTEVIKMGYDVLEEIIIRKKYILIKYFNKEILLKHYILIFKTEEIYETEDIIINLVKKIPKDDNIFILILKYMNKVIPPDYMFQICTLFLDGSKFASFFTEICLSNNKVPYGLLKYPVNRDRIMLHFRNDKKLLKEYLECKVSTKVLFKILYSCNDDLKEDVYRFLIIFPNKKIINVIKSKLKRAKYLYDYREIYQILELLIEYKSTYVIEGIFRELIECIEIDKQLNILIRKTLLIFYKK